MVREFIPQSPSKTLQSDSDKTEFIPRKIKMNIINLKDGIIAGMILGDGHLKAGTPTLRLLHTSTQKGYLEFKLSLAAQIGYRTKLYNDTIQNTNLGTYRYSTGVIRGLDIAKFYYIPTIQLVDMLNPLGMLLWWLDDGSLTIHQKDNGSISRFGYLNTQAYGIEENEYLKRQLYTLFGIETSIHIDTKSGLALKNHYRLYLNATNFRRFIDLVRGFIPWVPRSMLYKLNMKYVKNRLKDSEYLAEYYNF